MRRHLVWAIVAAAACGSGGSGSTNNPTSPGGGSMNPGTSPQGVQVSIMDYSFSPQTVSVKAGTPVTWTNDGAVAHTATADGGAFNSGQLGGATGGGPYGGGTPGGTYSFQFNNAGTFNYHCANHTYMTGTVTVTP